MTAPPEIAGDIVAAASALAGLILVYIGALSASFSTYEAAERKSVIGGFQRRAWFAFVGLALFLLAVLLALFGKWLQIECMIIGALMILAVATAWLVATAILTVREIK